MKATIIIFLLFISTVCFADERISDVDHIIKPLVGKRIQIDGIAWGAFAKGLGERVVLSSGDKIYLSGKEYLKKHTEGKLVRIIGVLSIKKVKPVSKYEQGYTSSFIYYSLEVESFELIDVVENEFPKEV
ncbi:MAG: hypothetical protein KAI43_08495 [Candidatus Aureabacteria bacterium]|nr:hypothetical protein [Candidatus Auribacterota bacterium]